MLQMAPNMDGCIHIKPETAWKVILEQNDSIVHGFLVTTLPRMGSAHERQVLLFKRGFLTQL